MISLILAFIFPISTVLADHGGWSCDIDEPRQRAIILHNGDEEIMVLSTDVASIKDGNIKQVEFTVFPNQPRSQVKDINLYSKLAQLAKNQNSEIDWATDFKSAAKQILN
ncbi:MAG: hypothetical protein K1X44_05240 [Alphaproteobacteria bacterium]|nr:hypothetical protein [Alphaproteobacteria bacterium]